MLFRCVVLQSEILHLDRLAFRRPERALGAYLACYGPPLYADLQAGVAVRDVCMARIRSPIPVYVLQPFTQMQICRLQNPLPGKVCVLQAEQSLYRYYNCLLVTSCTTCEGAPGSTSGRHRGAACILFEL